FTRTLTGIISSISIGRVNLGASDLISTCQGGTTVDDKSAPVSLTGIFNICSYSNRSICCTPCIYFPALQYQDVLTKTLACLNNCSGRYIQHSPFFYDKRTGQVVLKLRIKFKMTAYRTGKFVISDIQIIPVIIFVA